MKLEVYDLNKELAKGNKTKMDKPMLAYLALDDYPHIQRLIAKVFGIW